jgi:hypothetical protein
MSAKPAVSRARRIAASGALLAGAGLVAWEPLARGFGGWFDGTLLAIATLLGAAAVGISRRSLFAQIGARAIAWLTFGPLAFVSTVALLGRGHLDGQVAALAAASGAALALAQPMLETADAKARFAPLRFRRWLLAGATSSTAAAMVAALLAFDALGHSPVTGVALGALAASLLGAAVGVLRMRAWGILLGGLTSVASLVSALAFAHGEASVALVLAAVPGLVFSVPIVLARWGLGGASASADAGAGAGAGGLARARLAAELDDDLPARIRVADERTADEATRELAREDAADDVREDGAHARASLASRASA